MGKDWYGEKEEPDENGLRTVDRKVLACAMRGLGIDLTARTLGINLARVKLVRGRVKDVFCLPRDAEFSEAVEVARELNISLDSELSTQ